MWFTWAKRGLCARFLGDTKLVHVTILWELHWLCWKSWATICLSSSMDRLTPSSACTDGTKDSVRAASCAVRAARRVGFLQGNCRFYKALRYVRQVDIVVTASSVAWRAQLEISSWRLWKQAMTRHFDCSSYKLGYASVRPPIIEIRWVWAIISLFLRLL